MNRLIIIGNGFDIAHGLKTRYTDFLLYLLKKVGVMGTKRQVYEYLELRNKGGSISSHIDPTDIEEPSSLILLHDRLEHMGYEFRGKGIFEPLCRPGSMVSGWVDVEWAYFKILRSVVNGRIKDLSAGAGDLRVLHESMEFFTHSFTEYLKENVEPRINKELKLEGMERIFQRYYEKAGSGNTFILNFNYTNTPEIYNHKEETIGAYIHGTISRNNIVLGYGDEHHETYRDIENLNVDEYLAYQKSHFYSLSEDYGSLEHFLHGRDFDVFIIGHSCGLSDRTLLKHILDRGACRKIRLFPYKGEENFIQTYRSLSRHFTDKSDLRGKIVPYNEEDICPQHGD